MANEYAVNQADLVAVADVLREKANTAENLVFPNDFVALISAFSGLPSEISKLDAGTYTVASNTTGQITITHNLGEIPDFYLFVQQGKATVNASYASIFCDLYLKKLISTSTSGGGYIQNVAIKCWAMSGGIVTGQFEKDVTKADATTFWVNGIPASNRTYFSGNTFYWVCGKFA